MKKSRLLIIVLMICLTALFITACNKTKDASMTVIFNTNGGNEIASITVNSGTTTVTLPADPIKEGYIFDEWFFDNETFLLPVNSVTILAKLTEGLSTVTVYAKWVEEEVDLVVAKTSLKAAGTTIFMSTSGKNVPEELDAEQIARLAELELALDINDSDETYDKYYFIEYQLHKHNNYLLAQEYIALYDAVIPTQVMFERMNEIADLLGLNGKNQSDSYDNALGYVANYADDLMDNDTYTDSMAYYNLILIKKELEDFQKDLAGFEENFQKFVDLFELDDIRAGKLMKLAIFIDEFDFDTLLIEDEDGYYYSDPSKVLDFIFAAIDASEFTSNDVGMFMYKALGFAIDQAIIDLSEDDDYLEDEIENSETQIANLTTLIANFDPTEEEWILDSYKQEKSRYERNIEYYEERLIENAQMAIVLAELKTEITLQIVTDFSEVYLGITRIINDNNVIELIFNASNGDNPPTIAELATIIASISDACKDISAAYPISVWNSMASALEGLVGVFSSIDSADLFISEFILPILESDFNPSKALSVLSDVLDLFDVNTLNVFLNEVTEDHKMKLKLDYKDNEYFMDNLVILEAKLVVALTGGVYDEEALSNAYDSLIADMSDTLSTIMESEDDIELEGAIALPLLLDLITNLMKEKIVISEVRYNEIKSIALLSYVTSGETTVTPVMYKSVVIMNAVSSLKNYQSKIEELLLIFDDEINKSSASAIAIGMYALNIDYDDFSSFVAFVSSEIDFVNNCKEYIAAQILSALITELGKDVFVDLITLLGSYGFQFIDEILTAQGFDNVVILDLVDLFAIQDSVMLEDLAYFLVSMTDIMVGVILDSMNPITGAIYEMVILDNVSVALLEVKALYVLVGDQTGLINILEEFVTVLREFVIPSMTSDLAESYLEEAGYNGTWVLNCYNMLSVELFVENITEITLGMIEDESDLDLLLGTEAIDNAIVIDLQDNVLLAIYSTVNGQVSTWTASNSEWVDSSIGTYDIYEEQEYMLIALNMVVELADYYGFEGTIDRMIALINELKLAGGPGVFQVEEGQSPDNNMFILFANVVIILVGDTNGDLDTIGLASFIASAGEDNNIANVLAVLFDPTNYALIQAIASETYGVEPGIDFAANVQTLMVAITGA